MKLNGLFTVIMYFSDIDDPDLPVVQAYAGRAYSLNKDADVCVRKVDKSCGGSWPQSLANLSQIAGKPVV